MRIRVRSAYCDQSRQLSYSVVMIQLIGRDEGFINNQSRRSMYCSSQYATELIISDLLPDTRVTWLGTRDAEAGAKPSPASFRSRSTSYRLHLHFASLSLQRCFVCPSIRLCEDSYLSPSARQSYDVSRTPCSSHSRTELPATAVWRSAVQYTYLQRLTKFQPLSFPPCDLSTRLPWILCSIAQYLPRRHERFTYAGDTELSPRMLQVRSTPPSIVEAG